MALKVAFCAYGKTDDARMMIDTCKRLGYSLTQVSDLVTPKLDGVDELIRVPMDDPPELFRFKCTAAVEPPFLWLDTDVLVLRDVSSGIDPAFDACLTWRHDNGLMPFNSGVFFVNNRGFVEDVVRRIEAKSESHKAWFGGQIAMREAVESKEYKIKSLDCREWNNYWSFDKPGNARILHFKGTDRRPLMAPTYRRLFGCA